MEPNRLEHRIGGIIDNISCWAWMYYVLYWQCPDPGEKPPPVLYLHLENNHKSSETWIEGASFLILLQSCLFSSSPWIQN